MDKIAPNNPVFANGGLNSCDFCTDQLGPPPDDILYMPPPPLPPSVQAYLMPQRDIGSESEATSQDFDMKCNYCTLFGHFDNDNLSNAESYRSVSQSSIGIVMLSIVFISSALITMAYLWRIRRGKSIASSIKGTLFSSPMSLDRTRHNSNGLSCHDTLPHHGVRPNDPCLMPIGLDKTLSSPNIITDVPHKKTSISSKYWAQPGIMMTSAHQISRIPNDYEATPSSRTNSTCTSSAVYADDIQRGRFLLPTYNIQNSHTYAQVLEPNNEPSSMYPNGPLMIPNESNYDQNSIYSHGSLNNASNGALRNDSSLQLTLLPNQHRAQLIVTSNAQGCGPTIMSYDDRVNHVI